MRKMYQVAATRLTSEIFWYFLWKVEYKISISILPWDCIKPEFLHEKYLVLVINTSS